jgi:hypothetical protein
LQVLKRVLKRIFKITAIIIGVLLVLVVGLFFAIRLPAVQNFITGKAVGFVTAKTHTRMSIKRLYIAFPKSVVIEGLFAEDTRHDTLLSLQKLSVDINMMALLDSKIEIGNVALSSATANIHRGTDSIFNFAFLIDAFSKGGPKKPKAEKDTTAGGLEVQVKKVMLENIRGSFVDEIGGTNIHGVIGKLSLSMNNMNLKKLSFNGDELVLEHTEVSMVQGRNSKGENKADTAIVLMPLLSLNKLQAKQVKFDYKDTKIQFAIHAGKLYIVPEVIDLNKHQIKIKQLHLAGTQAKFAMQKSKADTVAKKMEADAKAGKGWQISGNEVRLDSVDFSLDMTGTPSVPGSVDYNHLGLRNAHISIDNAFYSPEDIHGTINNLSLQEKSGLNVKRLSAQVAYDDTHASLKNLTLITNNTQIGNQLSASWPSLKRLATDVGELGVDANFSNTRVAVNDILFFAPMLKKQAFFMNNRDKTVTLSGKVKGKLKDITATGLQVGLSGGTDAMLSAHITGLPDAINAWYDVQIQKLSTNSASIAELTGGKLPQTIQLPQELTLAGTVKGSLKDAIAKLALTTNKGNIDIDATFRMAAGDTQYTAILNTEALDLGYILKKDTLLGKVTMNAQVRGRNFALPAMQDSLSATIQSIGLKQHTYRDIILTANADSGTYSANITIKDTALVMDLKAAASFVKGREFIDANIIITTANLQQMNLVKEEMIASGKLEASTKGPLKDMNGRVRLGDILITQGEDNYRLDSLLVLAASDSIKSTLSINSELITAQYDGNIKLLSLPKMMVQHVSRYFEISKDSIGMAADSLSTDTSGQNFKLVVNVLPHPIITKLLVPKLENFTGASVTADFDKNKSKLNLAVSASSLAYSGIKAADVSVSVNSDEEALKYSVSLQGLTTGPVKLSETSVSGAIQDNDVGFALRIHGRDTLDKLLVSGNVRQDSTKTYALYLNNDKLILGNEPWQLTEDNYIRFGKAGLYFHNFVLNNNEQSLSIKSAEADNGTIKAEFRKFELGTLSQVIETDTALIRGVLDGDIEFRNLKATPAFVSDLKISNVAYLEHPIGDLALKADNLTADKYSAQLLLSGSENDMQVKGFYSAAGTSNVLDFDVAIRKLNLNSIEPFTAGQLRRSSGYITGALKVNGPVKQPVINGDVRFKDAAFNLAYINNYLTLKDEHIAIDGKGIYLRSFTILDSLGQKASVAGAVYTSDFKKMRFDVNIKTNNFTVLNTHMGDNELFFGHVLLNSNITVKGTEQLPIVDVTAKLLDGSNFAVIIPSSKITVDRGEGVVVLIDSASQAAQKKAEDTVAIAAQFKGIKLSAKVEITRQTAFKLIVDKSSGDSLVIKGEGVLSFNMNESGGQSLTGTYRVFDGSYKASFQKIIKKVLTIQPGGYITWNGSVTDANVDITAVYAIKTSPSDLLASELASATTGERNTYKKLMNFKVLMRMRGQLLKPEISFKLDMAEEDQNAFGGSVYSKINSLNNDPSELNKQVFALLILNKFIPAGVGGGGSDASGNVYANAATSLARNSLNQVLTDQLNQLSGKYIKFVDLSVGINANDEYTTSGVNQNTQLSVGLKKSFFKERLSVQVGTSVNVQNDNGAVKGLDANNLTGDIVVEYKINEDGSLRFKAFRENQYEGLIDGSLYKTGVGVVFSRDYDKEKELLVKLPKKKKKKDTDIVQPEIKPVE